MANPNGDMKLKKTSDEEKEEEGQEPVEETEAKKAPVKVKKGKAEEAEPKEKMEKGMAEEEHEEAQGQKSMAEKLDHVISVLEKLVASDKKVHSTVEKGETSEEEEEKPEKEEKKAVKKASGNETDLNIVKASMEQDFQKALTDAVAPLQAQINALTEQVQKLGDEPLYKSGLLLTQIKEDGTMQMTNAGALAAQRKKNQQTHG